MRTTPLLAIVAFAVSGCATLPPAGRACDCPQPRVAWNAMLSTAIQLSEAGRFEAVDSAFVAFAATHPASQEAHEVGFWRALYKLDPRNPSPQPVVAMQMLDDYMLSGSVHWYRLEARVLRELATLQNGGSQSATTQPPVGPATPGVPPRATTNAEKDAEIQQLRERNARLEAELERIRRRLSTP